MMNGRTRRQYLLAVGTAGVIGVAGCSGNQDASPDSDEDEEEEDEERDDSVTGGAPMFQYDLANTGHAPGETGPAGPVTDEWTVGMDGSVQSSPAVVNGTVYVGSADDSLYAVDAATGEAQWTFETGGSVRSSPAVVNGTVYVGSDDNHLYAVDAATGEETWAFQTREAVASSPAVAAGTVYVGSDGTEVYAVDAATGEGEWTRQTGGGESASPAVVDGTVYVWNIDGTVTALDAATGDRQWAVGTDEMTATPDGNLDAGTGVSGGDRSVAVATGDAQPALQVSGALRSSPAVANGTVYVQRQRGTVVALDAVTGDRQWSAGMSGTDDAAATGNGGITAQASAADDQPGSSAGTRSAVQVRGSVASSLAVANGTVYAGSPDGTVAALDATTGDQQWSVQTGGLSASSSDGIYTELSTAQTVSPMSLSLAVVGVSGGAGGSSDTSDGGTVYVGSLGGRVYALDAATGDRQWQSETSGQGGSSLTVVDGYVFVNGSEGLVAVAGR
ncbi:outer membrane protein assembly factor BamB family protein [Halorientalis salina]|uniref:outer membrane protein assembly factor BamB family protein n=1 Tax=Halorientalis salina TaxID=2932266 RepID=UPI0010ABF81F|nr:PQQ-binding-like beta-propeller repeat protein [Halorientalis salina]